MASEPRPIWGDLASSAFVLACPLFKSLDEEAGADLLRVAELVAYAPGEVVVRQGEPGEELFLVREGSATVTVADGAGSREVGLLDRGAVFGELALSQAPVRSGTVTARTDLSVVRFPGQVVSALAERFPRVGKLLEALQGAGLRDRR